MACWVRWRLRGPILEHWVGWSWHGIRWGIGPIPGVQGWRRQRRDGHSAVQGLILAPRAQSFLQTSPLLFIQPRGPKERTLLDYSNNCQYRPVHETKLEAKLTSTSFIFGLNQVLFMNLASKDIVFIKKGEKYYISNRMQPK